VLARQFGDLFDLLRQAGPSALESFAASTQFLRQPKASVSPFEGGTQASLPSSFQFDGLL
jgi:hypothetical protein